MIPGVVFLVVLLMIAGVVGSVIPFLPGTPLILAGALLYAFSTDFEPVGPWHLALLGALAGLAWLADYVAGATGAKLGGSRWTMVGALVGGIVGLFFGPIGILAGPIIGAVGFELINSRELNTGLKSGAGTIVGMLVGTIAKFSISIIMVGLLRLLDAFGRIALSERYQEWMTAAIEQAEKSWSEGGIPIGSVLVDAEGGIVARGHNEHVQTGDPTAHAEMVAIRHAGRRRDWSKLTLVSTLSP